MRMGLFCTVIALVAFFTGCARRRATSSRPAMIKVSKGWTQDGIASWYGNPYHGRKTSSGEVYDMNRLTAAHPTLPFGVWVEVRNKKNSRKVDVKINDRGPFVDGRIIDISRAAAQAIDMIGPGTAPVRIKVIRTP